MNSPTPAAKCETLEQVRCEIDALNSQILHCLAQRQRYVERAAALKTNAAAIPAPARQAAILARVRTEAAQLGMSVDVAEAVFRCMIAAFIELEQHEFKHSATPP